LEHQVDRSIEEQTRENAISNDSKVAVYKTTAATMKTVESVRGGELLMQAVDLVEAEVASIREWDALYPDSDFEEKKSTAVVGLSKTKKRVRQQNPILLGLTPLKYMLSRLRLVKAPDLENALLVMPFHYVKRFITILLQVQVVLKCVCEFVRTCVCNECVSAC
jgi:U3 small nucleolar RNA-associated protein 12